MNSTQHSQVLSTSILITLSPPSLAHYLFPPSLPFQSVARRPRRLLLLLAHLIISPSLLICAIQMFLYVVIKQRQTLKLFINNIKQKVSSTG